MTPKTLTRTLAIKERLRQVRRAELREAEARVNEAQTSLELEATRRAGAAELITRAGEHSANDLALYAEQVEQSTRAVKQAAAKLNEREEERETQREVVGEATREVKAIAALHARLVAEQRRTTDRREQAELDEASARKGKTR